MVFTLQTCLQGQSPIPDPFPEPLHHNHTHEVTGDSGRGKGVKGETNTLYTYHVWCRSRPVAAYSGKGAERLKIIPGCATGTHFG